MNVYDDMRHVVRRVIESKVFRRRKQYAIMDEIITELRESQRRPYGVIVGHRGYLINTETGELLFKTTLCPSMEVTREQLDAVYEHEKGAVLNPLSIVQSIRDVYYFRAEDSDADVIEEYVSTKRPESKTQKKLEQTAVTDIIDILKEAGLVSASISDIEQ